MILEIWDAIRRRDQMHTGTVDFCSAKRQVADMMRAASARFIERDFDPGPQRVLWPNFRCLGFYNSSDFPSLRVGVKDFADYFAYVPVLSVHIPASLGHLGGFSFRHIGLVECFSAFKSITSNAVGARTVFLLIFLNYCLHLFVIMCCIFSISTSSVLPSM
jgi:hypothetical protein